MASTVFKVRRTLGSATIFFVVFGLFIPAGIAVWIWADPFAGLAIAGFGVIAVLLMALQIAAAGTWYSVGLDGLVLKRGGERRTYDRSLIAGARVIDQEEADAILNSFTRNVMESERAIDLKGWLLSNVAYGKFTRFCTVPIVQSKTSAGHISNVVGFSTKTTGSFVLLKLSDGKHLLLSPQDVEGFYRALSTISSLSDPVQKPSEGWAGSATPEDKLRRQKGRRRYIAYVIVSAVLILAGVGYFFRDTIFSQLQPQIEPYTELPQPETGWIGTDAFRLIITTPPVASDFFSDREARKQQITRQFDESYYFGVTGALLDWYYAEYDVWPMGKLREDLHATVMSFVRNLEAELLRADFDDDMTTLTAWVEVGAEGLQTLFTETVQEVLNKGAE